MLTTREIKWDILLDQLENGKCAVVFGHELLTDAAGQARFPQFCQQYAEEHADSLYAYYPEENFFLFKQDEEYTDFGYYLGKFYANALSPADEVVYQQLAELPFSLYISVAADDFVARKLKEHGRHTYYGNTDPKLREVEATRSQPLVYNIFGSVQDTSQVIFSHDALYTFLQDILVNNQLPRAVEQFFNATAKGGEVLFIGFDFRQWYVQLLLRILNLTKTTNKLKRTASLGKNKTAQQEKLPEYDAQHHFKINFVDKDCKEFVQQLYDKCKERGLLRDLTSLKEKGEVLDIEAKKQRLDDLKKQRLQANKLLNEWEEKEMLADNPKERMLCETEIGKLKEKIEQLTQAINDLTKPQG